MIIICINDNNSAINNNYGPLQDLMLLFENPMCKRKYFFEIYRLLGHVSSKRLASPVTKIIRKRNPSKILLFQLYEVLGFIEDSPY
jgi:deoxyxylulose-5-phosphate synthase